MLVFSVYHLYFFSVFAGLSGKSQIMFAIVFTSRYLDLFTNFISLYNTCMKVIFIGTSYFTVFLLYSKFKATYDSNHDTFRIEFLLVPVAGLSFLVNHDFSPLEVIMLCCQIDINQIRTIILVTFICSSKKMPKMLWHHDAWLCKLWSFGTMGTIKLCATTLLSAFGDNIISWGLCALLYYRVSTRS